MNSGSTRESVLIIRPSFISKASAVGLCLLGLFGAFHLVGSWSEFTRFGHIAMTAGVIVFVAIGANGLQRQYVFERHRVKQRLLFRWIVFEAPPHTTLEEDADGRIVLTVHGGGGSILRIPREYSEKVSLDRLRAVLFGISSGANWSSESDTTE